MRSNTKSNMTIKMRKRLEQEQKLSAQRQKLLGMCSALFFIVITTVFPLYLDSTKYLFLTEAKSRFFWIATAIAAGMVLLLLAWFKMSAYLRNLNVLKADGSQKVSLPEWALIAFLFIALISALSSRYQSVVWMGFSEPSARHEGFVTFLCYGITFWIIERFYTPRNWHLYVFAAGAISVAVIGILQFADMDIFNLFPYYYYTAVDQNGNPLYGGFSIFFRTTLGNVNIVSSYVSLTIPLFLALYAGSKTRWRFVYLASTATNFGMLMIEGSDAGRVGIMAAMVLLLPYWLAEKKRLGRVFVAFATCSAVYALYLGYLRYRVNLHLINPTNRASEAKKLDNLASKGIPELWPFLLLAVILLVIGIALIYLLKKPRWPKTAPIIGLVLVGVIIIGGLVGIEVLGSRWSDQPNNMVYQAREVLHGRMQDDFGSGRGWIWKKGLGTIPDHWVLGSGPDTYYYALGETLQEEHVARTGVSVDKAHNTFLQIAVTIGIPALLCYLVFLFGIFVPAVKKAFKNPLLLAAGAASVAYMVQSFFCVEVPITSPLYWVMLGLMACEMRIMNKNMLQNDTNPDSAILAKAVPSSKKKG